MAAQVKLVRRRDFGSDISSLSLFNYEDGFSLTRDGWIQAVARDGDESVAEAMTLRVEASSHDDLASMLQLMDGKIEEVSWYDNAAERYGVWLRTQLPDEAHARQALIKEAGGFVTDINGGKNYVYGRNILAANQSLHAEFLKKLKQSSKKETIKNKASL